MVYLIPSPSSSSSSSPSSSSSSSSSSCSFFSSSASSTTTVMLVVWVMSLAVLTSSVHASLTGFEEVCERTSTFDVKCEKDEKLLFRRSRYGRMKTGKCISDKHLGCSQDVTRYLDSTCGGRRSCKGKVSDLLPEHVQPCPSDYRSYLQVAYECVKVHTLSSKECAQSPMLRPQGKHGFLSSEVAELRGCGGVQSPWYIVAARGQTIEISLYDFGIESRRSKQKQKQQKNMSYSPRESQPRENGDIPSSSMENCMVYAVVSEDTSTGKDRPSQLSKTICASNASRYSTVFRSTGSSVYVRIVGRIKNGYFMLRYNTKGCADPPPPENGWVFRTGNRLHFGCNNSRNEVEGRVDTLTSTIGGQVAYCNGTSWSKELITCPAAMFESQTQFWKVFKLGKYMSIILISIIAISVGFCILGVGLFYIRKKPIEEPSNPYTFDKARTGSYPGCRPQKIMSPQCGRGYDGQTTPTGSDNDYYRTWQLQRRQAAAANCGLPPPAAISSCLPGHALPMPPPPALTGDTQRRPQHPPHKEHIYESPKFDRRASTITTGGVDTSEPEDRCIRCGSDTLRKTSRREETQPLHRVNETSDYFELDDSCTA